MLEFNFLFLVSWPTRKRDKCFVAFHQLGCNEFYGGTGRPVVAPSDQLLNGVFVALHRRVHASVLAISHPAIDLQCLRNGTHRFTKSDPLYPTCDHKLHGDNLATIIHSSCPIFLLRTDFTVARVFFASMRRSFDARVGLVARRFFGM